MARSKDVYAVLGLMCIDPAFREQFFAAWLPTSKRFIGSLSQDERDQLGRLAGEGFNPTERSVYVARMQEELEDIQQAMGCPSHPCPDPDSWAS